MTRLDTQFLCQSEKTQFQRKNKNMEIKKLTSSHDYLLPEKLEGLHAQSAEWLKTLAFWKDEVRFFAKLVRGRQTGTTTKESGLDILENLEHLHQMLFDYLYEEILAHERLLSRIEMNATGIADAAYRDAHRKLAERMQAFEEDFRVLKKTVFELAKHW
jgi:hypothetical protein